MGSCAAPSAKGDDKFITTDYLQQCLPRYGLDGLPAGQVSECDALNARRWLAVREQQKLKMKTMQEQSASTEKTER
ncbi:hypothetical protein FLI35_23840 [Salmonella enterica]|uniref:Uncharacterized protein n=1 Tax=Salmonella enterica TaxID=28901 RepID=A0A5Y3TNQ3_SALER|nr:hypothetical protein [Salmonella enterica subsp. enterica serovar Infantis]